MLGRRLLCWIRGPPVAELLKKPSSAGLSFDAENDAINYARKVVQESAKRLASYAIDFSDAYEKGHAWLVFTALSASNGEHFYLIVNASNGLACSPRDRADVASGETEGRLKPRDIFTK